jgi:hypothetical protein
MAWHSDFLVLPVLAMRRLYDEACGNIDVRALMCLRRHRHRAGDQYGDDKGRYGPMRPDNSTIGFPSARAASLTAPRALTSTMPLACAHTARSDLLSPT